jgi:hypothetical protein
MRKIIVFVLLFTSMLTYAATKVEVYYFHYSRRCATCNAVEEVSKKTISESFASQFKKREITFKSVNLDEKSSVAIAKKCKAEGQALLIVSNGKRVDLTDKAFMYAKSNPEKLKAELKKAIGSLL